MITFEYIKKTYPNHKSIIEDIEKADDYRYGRNVTKDEEKAFSLYQKIWDSVSSCFSEKRCFALIPYISDRLCECYSLGIGVKKDLIKASSCLMEFAHFVYSLPRICQVSNVQTDPNYKYFKSRIDNLLQTLNGELKKQGFILCLSDNGIKVFSKFRLPFERSNKKGVDYSIFREVISNILDWIPRVLGEKSLNARYGTLDTGKYFYDLENVLFYNFGFSKETLKYKTEKGVAFSRISTNEVRGLQIKENIPNELCHCYEYFSDPIPCLPNNAERLIVQWESQPFIAIKSSNSASDYWKAMRQISYSKIAPVDTKNNNRFSLYLEIEKPRGEQLYLLGSLKSLLDGVISALHGGEFSEKEILSHSEKLNVPREWFLNNNMNILGRRKYIQFYPSKSGIKWNPADDLCDKVSVSVVEGKTWKIKGRVYEIPSECIQ